MVSSTRVTVTVCTRTRTTRQRRLVRLLFMYAANAWDEAVYAFRMWRLHREERRLLAQLEVLALLRRCEYEDRLWHAGDPRGTYGQYPPYITPQQLERF
jgi:hypothetical protein